VRNKPYVIMASLDQPLSDAEYARIAVMLERSRDKRAMNLEMLDGFFAALICSPDMVPPSEYLREIWGGDRVGEFQNEAEMQEFFDLVIRHWNSLARTLNSNEPFLPFLFEDDAGVAHGNDWAQGFMRGMKMRREEWADLLENDVDAGLLVPVLALAHEHATCGRTRSQWMRSGANSWWWVSPQACLASTATSLQIAARQRGRRARPRRIGAMVRRSDGIILARAGQGRSSRNAAGR
jgi:yecA family protein